jgi:hypothetical protein
MKELKDAKIVMRRSVAMAGTIDTRHDSVSVLYDGEMRKSERDNQVFEDARVCYDNLETFRKNAMRCHRYTYGDQWGDRIVVGNKSMTEDAYLREQGKVPLKNNMIRNLVKSVLGQFEGGPTRPVCVARNREDQTYGEMMTLAMECVYDTNRMDSLDAKTLESYMVTGIAVHKSQYTWLSEEQRHDVYVKGVSPYKVFFDNRIEDHAFRDISLIGELHDMALSDVVRIFAGSNQAKAQRIRRMYSQSETMSSMVADTLKGDKNRNSNFYVCEDPNMCRVIEVWRRESREFIHCHDVARGRTYRVDIDQLGEIERINERRLNDGVSQGIAPEDVALIETEISLDNYWYVRYFTPHGEVIAEYENPYWHGSHPYELSIYPFINQEVHSFVEDVIDQQRYINRLITMIDFIMGASAKGVLMMPEDAIPDGMRLEDITAEWVKYNGVILFKNKPGGALPQQISTNATNVGAYELLNLQMKLIQDISGVQNALQGKTPRSGTSGVQYEQESINAANNLINLMSSFREFREGRDRKIVKLMQQYYKDDMPLNVPGSHSDEAKMYRADAVRDVDYMLSISESATSPTYRMMSNELLLQLFQMQAIDVKSMLKNGSFPNADRLLADIEQREQQMQELAQQQQAMQGGGVMPAGAPMQ